jgi:hypothetical protein
MEALRETQVEDHEHIAELRRRLVTFEQRSEQRFGRLEQRFDGLERGQGMILDLLRPRNGEEPPASAE